MWPGPARQLDCTQMANERALLFPCSFWNAFAKAKETRRPEVSALNPFVAKIR